jgi:anaerobic selenocysteine-containing dehydrogenase
LLCAGGAFGTADGRARFRPVAIPDSALPEGAFRVSTRRGKQFNTMVHAGRDPLTGAPRDAVLMSPEDAGRMGLADGDPIVLRSEAGAFRGRVFAAAIKPGNLQVHFPEANSLLTPGVREPASGIPDYNAVVRVEGEAASGNGREAEPASRA